MKGKLVFLGTGGSMGVPIIGCECGVCCSDDPKNKRMRPSVYVKINNKHLLIDAGPEHRIQALRNGIQYLDGVLLTHDHHDHTAGIDDLRAYSFRQGKPLTALMSSKTAESLKNRYYYLLPQPANIDASKNRLQMQILEGERGEVIFQDIALRYLTYQQGYTAVNGFIIGSLAYISDIKTYPETIFEDLSHVETLVVSALRFSHSHLHFNVDDAVEFATKVGAKQIWITHISHDLDHNKTNNYLPSAIRLAYDGLEIDF